MKFTVETGKRYRASIELGILDGFAPDSAIVERLSDAGFVDITVTGSGRHRVATATWPGAPMTAELPSQIAHVVEVP